MNSKVYKWCAVPQCKNTSITTPNKVFIHVPNKKIIRDKWLKLARRNPNDVVTNSPLYFCEDHFDLPNDMENYMQYHVMGSVSQVRMIPGCMPKKFFCQPDRTTRTSDTTERPFVAKKRRMIILEECEKQLKEKSMVTEQSSTEEIASGSSDSEQNEDYARGADCAKDATSADNANSAIATTCAGITTVEDNIDAETEIQDCPIETDEQIFSWQRDSEINCDDFDVNQDTSTIVENVTELDDIVVKTELDDSLSLHGPESQTGEQVFKASEENDVHEGYRCDMCSGPIHRFRYSCVECANYDLCSACEASRGHPEHYLVRIPRPRPHGEIQLIMDTIRRFLTADLKALRTEVNFVDTLINEMKSEVSSEAGSDPVPDEPDYPVESSDDEDDGMEETIDTHSQDALETQDESQDITWLDEDILQDSELQETSDNLETIENNPDTISADTTIKLNSEHPQRPEKRKVNNTDEVKPITLGKVKKRVLINMPKKVSISNDAFELIKAKHGDPMERTINTIKHSLQSNVSIRLQRLSKEDLEAVTNSNK